MNFAPVREALFKTDLRCNKIAAIARRNGQRVERYGDAGRVVQFLRDGQALLKKTGSGGKITLRGGECSQEERRFSTFARVFRARELQDVFQPGAPFFRMLAHIPKAKQCHAEPEPPVQVAGLKEPVERRTKIVVLHITASQPGSALALAQIRVAFLG